jgi:hypothetical protein
VDHLFIIYNVVLFVVMMVDGFRCLLSFFFLKVQ